MLNGASYLIKLIILYTYTIKYLCLKVQAKLMKYITR